MSRWLLFFLLAVLFLTGCEPGFDADIAIHTLRDENKDVRLRVEAARQLGEIGPEPGVVDALVLALADEAPEVQIAAAQALGRIGPKALTATPALIEALGAGGDLQQAAAAALHSIAGEDLGSDPALWQEWWEAQP